jgi:hypothetical protein
LYIGFKVGGTGTVGANLQLFIGNGGKDFRLSRDMLIA